MNPVLTSHLSYLIFVCNLSKHPTSCLQLYGLTTVNNEVSLCVIPLQVVAAVNKYMQIIRTNGLCFT